MEASPSAYLPGNLYGLREAWPAKDDAGRPGGARRRGVDRQGSLVAIRGENRYPELETCFGQAERLSRQLSTMAADADWVTIRS